MGYVDLHTHTTASDGTDSPARVVEQAARLGLAAVAVTDHDTAAGVHEAREAGERLGIRVVPGIEVSSDYRDNNIHILGYFLDTDSPALRPVLDWVSTERDERNRKMCDMLSAAGFDVTMEEMLEEYPAAVLGRPHFAEHLMRKGYVASVQEGFDRYLEVGRPFFLPKRRISVARAVETIRQSGGVAVLAHPYEYKYPENETVELIEYAVELGIGGLECWYSLHTPEQTAHLLSLAERYDLAPSGGSDYHGVRKPHIAIGTGTGDMRVPDWVPDGLCARAGK